MLGGTKLRLSARLRAIADLIEPGTTVVDIGTDHAYLPIFLVQNSIVPRAVAGEVSRGPYKAAQNAINNANLEGLIDLRLGNGLKIVMPGEVDTAIIAGMGGTTIVNVLEDSPDVVKSLRRLIIQPMIAASAVRRWFSLNGWCIIDEVLVIDDGRMYEIIMAEKGSMAINEPILYEIGPVLWEKKPPLIKLHIERLISQTERILKEMAIGDGESRKFYEHVKKLQELEAKMACL